MRSAGDSWEKGCWAAAARLTKVSSVSEQNRVEGRMVGFWVGKWMGGGYHRDDEDFRDKSGQKRHPDAEFCII